MSPPWLKAQAKTRLKRCLHTIKSGRNHNHNQITGLKPREAIIEGIYVVSVDSDGAVLALEKTDVVKSEK